MICLQCRHKVTGELCRCQCGHSRDWFVRRRGPQCVLGHCSHLPLIPFLRKVKLPHSQKVPGVGHLLGSLKAVSLLAFLLGFHWAKIYWTESPFLPCSKGCEIHLGAVNTHSSLIQVLFPAGVRSTLERASLSVTWVTTYAVCAQVFSLKT